MNRYPCRCRSCDGRRTMAELPENMRNGCQCSGFPFDNGTHRKGSSSPSNGWYCIHNVKGEGNVN